MFFIGFSRFSDALRSGVEIFHNLKKILSDKSLSIAVGDTMSGGMAAGLNANLTANPLENVTTVTVQIVVALIGDQEFDDPKTLSAFALGLVLFFVTLILNVIALSIGKRYREKYE